MKNAYQFQLPGHDEYGPNDLVRIDANGWLWVGRDAVGRPSPDDRRFRMIGRTTGIGGVTVERYTLRDCPDVLRFIGNGPGAYWDVAGERVAAGE